MKEDVAANAAFLQDVEPTIALCEKAIRHADTRTRQMIEERGEIEALSRRMVSADLRQASKVLRDNDQLDKMFEALVVRLNHLFGSDSVEAAQRRLANPHQLP